MPVMPTTPVAAVAGGSFKYNLCAGIEFVDMQTSFCASKVNAADSDYRVQNKESCFSYYCPLCCKTSYKGMEILSCQKECHNALNLSKKSQAAVATPATPSPTVPSSSPAVSPSSGAVVEQ